MSIKPISNQIEITEKRPHSPSEEGKKITHRLIRSASILQGEQARQARRSAVISIYDEQFSSELLKASSAGNLEEVKELLKKVPVNHMHPEYLEHFGAVSKALAGAASFGHVAVCKALLEYRCFPKEAARIALAHGQHEILALILEDIAKRDDVKNFIIQTVAEIENSPFCREVKRGFLEFGHYRDYSAYKEAAKNGHVRTLKIVMDYLLNPALFSQNDSRDYYEKEMIKNAVAEGTMLGNHPEMIQYAIESTILRGNGIRHLEVALKAGAIQKAEELSDGLSPKEIEDCRTHKLTRIFNKIFQLAIVNDCPKVIEKMKPIVELSPKEKLRNICLACQKGDFELINFLLDTVDNRSNVAFQAIYWLTYNLSALQNEQVAKDAMDFLFPYLTPEWLKNNKKAMTDLASLFALQPTLVPFFERIFPFFDTDSNAVFSNASEVGNIEALKLYFNHDSIEFDEDLIDRVSRVAALKYFLKESKLILITESAHSVEALLAGKNNINAATQKRNINTVRYLLSGMLKDQKEELQKTIQQMILLAVSKLPREPKKENRPLFLEMLKREFRDQIILSEEFLEMAAVRARKYGNNLSATELVNWML